MTPRVIRLFIVFLTTSLLSFLERHRKAVLRTASAALVSAELHH
jgi:hypothetical protein